MVLEPNKYLFIIYSSDRKSISSEQLKYIFFNGGKTNSAPIILCRQRPVEGHLLKTKQRKFTPEAERSDGPLGSCYTSTCLPQTGVRFTVLNDI